MRYPLAFALCAAVSAFAQPAATGGPDPREMPPPPIQTPIAHLPGPDALPAQPGLPDVFRFNDGSRVRTVADWARRRTEIRRTLEYYATGQTPPAPGNVHGRVVKSETVLDGAVTYRLVHLTFGPDAKLSLDIGIFTPAHGGPFPAIISPEGTPPGGTVLPRLPQGPAQGRGLDVLLPVDEINRQMTALDAKRESQPGAAAPRTPPPRRRPFSPAGATAESVASRHAEVFRRGYALVIFNNNDCAEDTTLRTADGTFAFRTTRFFPAYPGYDWGVLAGWAWGTSRIADYLVTDPMIDKSKLIITGASRAGKSAMIAAAFDDRLMGAPVVTGGGGIGAYRFTGPRHSETLDVMEKKYPNWFSPQLHAFWGQREKLPFDEHWFLALCAPRPFIALEGLQDVISLPAAVKASFEAAKPVYALYHAEGNLGVNYAHHAHAFTPEDWTALMDFADEHLRGMKVDRTFDHFPSDADLDALGRK